MTRPGRLAILALWVTLASGTILAVAGLVALPPGLVVAALVAFVLGLGVVVGLSYAHARRVGGSTARALWATARESVRWLIHFTP